MLTEAVIGRWMVWLVNMWYSSGLVGTEKGIDKNVVQAILPNKVNRVSDQWTKGLTNRLTDVTEYWVSHTKKSSPRTFEHGQQYKAILNFKICQFTSCRTNDITVRGAVKIPCTPTCSSSGYYHKDNENGAQQLVLIQFPLSRGFLDFILVFKIQPF